MKHTLTSKAAELMRKNGRHRRWRRAFSGMAAVVVFITTYMLILPAITMENQAICGMAEHTHTDACYEMQLVCTQEETPEGADVHVHGPECYEQQQVLTCTKQEGEGHVHSDACYGYVCGQEESAGHTHTDACYTEVTHRELTCTEPESAGHTHGDGCYDADGNLVCTEAESTGHTHGDSCYTETVTRELTCGQEESSGHTHTDACIGLICGQEEYEGHTHTDACYTTEDVLVCTEPTGHTHGDGCYEKVLVCDVPEHTHTEECYPAAEPEEPQEPQEPELICTLPEHSHEDACYDADGNLICGMEEHTHTEECYAPVEIPEEETPTTAFPEEIPEGYVEYTFDNEAGLTVTAYAPEGAFGQDVQLFAEVLSEDSEEYAQAKENLDKAENAPEYTGMAAMDIRFVDAAAEDPAAAEEIEPDAEMGQVFVKIDAQALLPEDVDESTLAVQHHVETESDKIFGVIPDFIHPETITVETVADNTEETGDVTLVPDAQAVSLEAQFAVESFSVFTVTYHNGKPDGAADSIVFYSVTVGQSITIRSNSGSYEHEWEIKSGDGSEYATVNGSRKTATVTGIKAGTVTITHSYRNSWRGETYTELFEVQVLDKIKVYVYVAGSGISDECLDLLGIDKNTLDGNGYFPAGEIYLDPSFLEGKSGADTSGEPLITSEADWTELMSALGAMDTSTLVDELKGYYNGRYNQTIFDGSYSNNIGNRVAEYLDQARQDIDKGWGSQCTALFRWHQDPSKSGQQHYGFADQTVKYHLDLMFNTKTIQFITGNNGIEDGSAKDGTTVDYRTYITGSEIQPPRNLEIPAGYRLEGYYSDPDFTKPWDGIGTPLNEDTTVYIKITEQENIVISYEIAQGEGTLSQYSEGLNPVTGIATGSKATPDTGYRFDGWYKEETCENLVSENTEFVPEKPDSGCWEEVTYYAKFVPTTKSLTIVKNIYGLTETQVEELVSGGYRSDSGLRFDVDTFSDFSKLKLEEEKSDNSEYYNYTDWTFNVADTLDSNGIVGNNWGQEITANPDGNSIDSDHDSGRNPNEQEHFGNSSLIWVVDSGEKLGGYWKYTVTISDIDISQNNIFRVWEQRMEVDGFKVTASVEEYPTGQKDQDTITSWYVSNTIENHGNKATAFELTQDTTVEFTNRYTQGKLSVTKDLTVNNVPVTTGIDHVFTFQIEIPAEWANSADSDKTAIQYGVTYSRQSGEETHENRAITFDQNGSTTIELYAGETAMISLPTGIQPTVTEINHDGYAVEWTGELGSGSNTSATSGVTTAEINADDPVEVICTNTTGAVLPSTGGMGTTPFLALGTLLTLGAGMLLVQRRRKEGSDAV